MRKLTIRDLLATLINAVVAVPVAGYSARGSMPFVHDQGPTRARLDETVRSRSAVIPLRDLGPLLPPAIRP